MNMMLSQDLGILSLEMRELKILKITLKKESYGKPLNQISKLLYLLMTLNGVMNKKYFQMIDF